MHSAELSVSRVDDSEPHRLIHSGRLWEVFGFHVLLDSFHPRSTRASWWSFPVLQAGAVKILASVSFSILAMWPNREKMHFLLIGSKFYFVFLIMTMFPHIAGSELCCYYYAIYPVCSLHHFTMLLFFTWIPQTSSVTVCPVWSRERCRISPPHFLAECHKWWLNQASFVLLCFTLFLLWIVSVYVLSVFLICLLSCIFRCEPTWMALYSLIVLMCRK